MNIIIATVKTWNIKNAEKFRINSKDTVIVISEKEKLNYDFLLKFKPDYIFFPHWSWLIPAEIYENFECIVFHMTDLPFGRGGSPLQNLVINGIKDTKISAIRVDGGIDTGNIYLKYPLNLNGTADEIFIRASEIIFNKMIPKILKAEFELKKQVGEIVEFSRRKPEESEIGEIDSLECFYDLIRILDGEGYPKAFICHGKYKLLFSRPTLKSGKIIADVEIVEIDHE